MAWAGSIRHLVALRLWAGWAGGTDRWIYTCTCVSFGLNLIDQRANRARYDVFDLPDQIEYSATCCSRRGGGWNISSTRSWAAPVPTACRRCCCCHTECRARPSQWRPTSATGRRPRCATAPWPSPSRCAEDAGRRAARRGNAKLQVGDLVLRLSDGVLVGAGPPDQLPPAAALRRPRGTAPDHCSHRGDIGALHPLRGDGDGGGAGE